MSYQEKEASTLNEEGTPQVKENEGQSNVVAEASSEPSRASARDQTYSPKGLEYNVNLAQSNFRSAVSTWRRHANKIRVALSDTTDLGIIRSERDILERNVGDVVKAYHKLLLMLEQGRESDVFKNVESFEDGLFEKCETIENEHQDLMCEIASFIREVESDAKSKSSRQSHSTSRCSGTTNNTRRSNATVKAAEIKAKLKYVDLEAKTKADMKRVQLMMELDMAEAKLEAMETLDDSRNLIPDKHHLSMIPKFEPDEYAAKYIQDLSAPPPVALSAPSPVTLSAPPPVTLSAPSPVTLSAPPPVALSAPPPVTVSAPSPVTIGLNPHIEEFVPQRYLPTAPQFSHFTPNPISTTVPPTSVYESSPKPTTPTALSSEQGMLHFAKTLAEQVNLSRLPPPEPSVFMGDPLKYPGWKAAFQTLIEQRQIPSSERIHYLKKYLGGAVKEVVENYFLLTSDDAYDDAKKLLDERYGDSFIIANAFRDKLEKWPKVNPTDGSSLQKFADFLRQCQAAMRTIGSLDVLNDNRENRKMLTKLPNWIVNRWARIVRQRKEEKNEFPPFKDFAEFIGREAKIACDPITSIQSLKTDHSRVDEEKSPSASRQVRRQPTGGRSFFTEVDESQTTNLTKTTKCTLCQGNHNLDDCRQFLAKSLGERKDYIREQRLCFGCLDSGHISRKCRQRKQCRTCSRPHPTSLHGDLKNTPKSNNGIGHSKEGSSNKTSNIQGSSSFHSSSTFKKSFGTCSKSSMIVPVYVSHQNNPENERLVYALLDTQSDTTFILEDTCRALRQSGTKVQLLLSTMHAENRVVDSCKVKGLTVRGFNSSLKIALPDVFTRNIMPANRSHIPTPEMAKQWPHLEFIADELVSLRDCEVGLLIGYNCSRALAPRDVIVPVDNGPYGQKTDLGWGIVGIVDRDYVEMPDEDLVGTSHFSISCKVPEGVSSDANDHVVFACKHNVKEVINPNELGRILEQDFNETSAVNTAYSHEDRQFLALMKEGVHITDGHYEMPLPFRESMPEMPNNKTLAFHRLLHLKKRIDADHQYRDHYMAFMEELIQKGFAEKVPEAELELDDGHEWYIPHHGVYHPQKPNKIRVVFDCSAKYKGKSLNSHLLQGPDLTNTLVGVLCRFRKEPVAFMCDIEQMFHQFKVNNEHRNYLRFLWWENGDTRKQVLEYRMNVHLFGAASSPGCANFGLKQMAADNEAEFGQDMANFVKRDFYVDDGLKSLPTVEEAVNMINGCKGMCSKGGTRLHKFISSSKEVLSHIPQEDRAKGLKNIDMLHDKLPVERALGIQWCIESDSFQFRIVLDDRPLTRRGVLSTLCSVYDPLGFISPFILVGKQILQQLCRDKTDWDSPLTVELKMRWERWRTDLQNLKLLQIRRCLKPVDFGEVVSAQLHHFSDASTSGYGQCSYLRLVNSEQQVHCALVMSKARVTPLKQMTIPRLELAAALVSVRVSSMLLQELEYSNIVEWYWTDSQVVLGYIANDAKRFHVFVANRVQQIRDHTEPSQWKYVRSEDNPADLASRGTTADDLVNRTDWFNGPSFIWESDPLPSNDVENKSDVSTDDPEVKRVQVFTTKAETSESTDTLLDRLDYFSNWNRAKRAIAQCLKFKHLLQTRAVRKPTVVHPLHKEMFKSDALSVKDLQEAELEIVRHVQVHAFRDEIKLLQNQDDDKRGTRLKGTSPLSGLDPFVDENGILRVGGRIRRGEFGAEIRHPVIFPKRSHITDILIQHYHQRIEHQGRGMTTCEIRSNGFWIIGCSSAVSSCITKCVKCRKLRGCFQGQKMADLPVDRLSAEPPFTYSGMDLFGPFYIKEGRKELKRYGVLFTCMSSRAIHLETANSLDTSSFINALRRFVSVRGPVRHLRSDRGTNFVGAERELREAFEELDDERLKMYLSSEGCDYISFKMNPPSASHMGGVWERQIRSVRNVLASLMHQSGSQLDDETLRTFLCEAAAIVNSRPLTTTTLNDPHSVEPLTPNHLLTMKTKIILPPPGQFQRTDLYCRRRWRRVQYLANEFWNRWRKEFLQTLQTRNKWESPKRNMCNGDVVIIKDDNLPRNHWRLGCVVETFLSEDGLVRKVRVAVGDPTLDKRGRRSSPVSFLDRPVHKLVLLRETEELPTEEPNQVV